MGPDGSFPWIHISPVQGHTLSHMDPVRMESFQRISPCLTFPNMMVVYSEAFSAPARPLRRGNNVIRCP